MIFQLYIENLSFLPADIETVSNLLSVQHCVLHISLEWLQL